MKKSTHEEAEAAKMYLLQKLTESSALNAVLLNRFGGSVAVKKEEFLYAQKTFGALKVEYREKTDERVYRLVRPDEMKPVVAPQPEKPAEQASIEQPENVIQASNNATH